MRRTPSETTAAMMRPELMEIKTHIKSLKKEAEMRLTLDVEAQQSFEFLSDQVQGLRKAFSTLSDVLIEEVDLIRSEAATRHEEVAEKLRQVRRHFPPSYPPPCPHRPPRLAVTWYGDVSDLDCVARVPGTHARGALPRGDGPGGARVSAEGVDE